ncbi:MAG TPA: alpha/beta hydrolase [Solirubrobacterales bacterium]|nr:alpha/beta hydrolase [Solirubrobacterales bacterium]
MNAAAPDRVEFKVGRDGVELAGEEQGAGPAIVALHGLTATRNYVVHGSRALPREGFRLVTYDARGHGESSPAPPGAGYAYPELAADLGAVLDARVGDRPAVLAGHSMGAHTLAAYALDHPDRIAATVIVGPASTGIPLPPESLEFWDRLAVGLERDGVDGFVAAYDHGLDPKWREVALRITRQRLGLHAHPEAIVRALREVPRSVPFDGLAELTYLDLPALVVASHDEADPGHPHEVAAAWSERLPRATLVSEEPGQSPLAWQGGRLSREIAAFCRRPEVAERLAG